MATLGIIGSHVAGDFFLGVDILVTSMLVNFLLMAVSVLTLPGRNPALARDVTVLPSRAAQVAARPGRRRGARRVSRRAHVAGPDRARGRVVFPFDAGVAPRDGRRLAHLLSRNAEAAPPGGGPRRALRDASSRSSTRDARRRPGRARPRPLHLARAHRPVADRRHGTRRPGARPRVDRARACALRRRRPHHLRHGRSLRVGRDRGGPSSRRARAAGAAAHEVGAEAGAADAAATCGRRSSGRSSGSAPAGSTCCSSTRGATPIRAGSTPCSTCRSSRPRV